MSDIVTGLQFGPLLPDWFSGKIGPNFSIGLCVGMMVQRMLGQDHLPEGNVPLDRTMVCGHFLEASGEVRRVQGGLIQLEPDGVVECSWGSEDVELVSVGWGHYADAFPHDGGRAGRDQPKARPEAGKARLDALSYREQGRSP